MKFDALVCVSKWPAPRALVAVCAWSLLACGTTAEAQTWTGNTTSSSWFNGSNWSGGIAPSGGATTTLTFGITSNTTLLNQDLATTFSLNKISFTTGNLAVGEASFTLTGGALEFVGSGAVIHMNNNAVTPNAIQTINNQIIMNASGGLTLSSSNIYSRFILNGNISTSLNNTAVTLTLAAAGTTATNVVNGVISNGTGTVSLVNINADGIWRFNSENTFSGNSTLIKGIYLLGAAQNALGRANVITLGGGAVIRSGLPGMVTLTNNFLLNSAATIQPEVGSGGITFSGGTISAATGVNTALTLYGANATGTNYINDLITDGSGTMSIITNGPETWVFTRSNNFTGTFNHTQGAVVIGANYALGSGTLVLQGGTFQVDGNYTLSNRINAVLGFRAAGDGSLTFTSPLSPITTSAANLTFTNFLAGGMTIRAQIQPLTNLRFSGSGAFNLEGGANLLAGTSLTFFNTGSVTSTLSVLNGAATSAFMKIGNATLVLGTAGAYAGGVTIGGGALKLNSAYADYFGNASMTLTGTGVLQAAGSITAGLGAAVGQIVWTQTSGFGASGGNLNVNLGNTSQTLVWGTDFLVGSGALTFSNDPGLTLTFRNPIDMNNAARTINVNGGTAVLTGSLNSTTPAISPFTKGGVGTLVLYGSGSFVGLTSVAAGELQVVGGAKLNSALHTYVATTGIASMLIADQGQVITSSTGFIGFSAGGVGAVTVSGVGSSWSQTGIASRLMVGYNGSGSLNVTNGGQVITANVGHVAQGLGSTGTATIAGAGSLWFVGSNLNVGNNGNGTLNVLNGGQVTVTTGGTLFIGTNSGAVGIVTVSGANALLYGGSTVAVGQAGTGTLNIQNGGQLIAASVLTVGNVGGVGTVNVNTTGVLSLSSALRVSDGGPGFLSVATGGRVATDNNFIVAWSSGSTGTATIDGVGSSVVVAGVLQVGATGVGAMNVQGGGLVSSTGAAYIGFSSIGTGTTTVDGANSALVITSSLSIGHTGGGTLSVQNGGSVFSRTGFLGLGATGVGAVTVSGSNSRWTVTEAIYVGGTASAAGGNGSVTLTNDGSLNVGSTLRLYTNGTLNLAGGAVATRTLNITGVSNNFVFTGGTLTISGGIVADAGYTLTLGSGQTLVDHGRITQTVTVASGGSLIGTGTYGNNLTVQSGGTLGGALSVTGVVTSAGAISPGTVGTVATMTLGGLVLNGGSLNFDLGTLNDQIRILTGGTVNVTASTGFNFNALVGLGVGSYDLITGYASLSGLGNLWSPTTFSGFSLSLADLGGTLRLTVTNPAGPVGPQNLVWTGATTGTWNTTSANWTGSSSLYTDGSNVTFSDSSSVRTLTIAGSVAPGSIVVDTAATYAIYGGPITGSTDLLKSGSGTLYLAGSHTFTGPTTVAGGRLQLGGDYVSNIDLQNATLQLNTATNQTVTGVLSGSGFLQKLGSGTSTLFAQNTFSGITSVDGGTLVVNHALSGTVFVNAGGAFSGSGSSLSHVIVQGGSGSITGTQAGALDVSSGSVTIENGGATTGTVTIDAGTLTALSGATVGNTLGINVNGGTFSVNSGATVVGNGQINVSGTLNADGQVQGLVVIENGGVTKGTGTVGGITVQSGGSLSVGHSVGTLTLDGTGLPSGTAALTLYGGADLVFEFNHATTTTGGTPGLDWDYIDLTGGGMLHIINANNQSTNNQITVHVDSWKLDNSGHGGGVSDGADFNGFNDAAATGWGATQRQTYYWKFIGLDDVANITVTDPYFGSIAGRFRVIDDAFGAGVFGAGNPFSRPENQYGKGTFKVVNGDFGQGYGMYIYYSAIPEPGSMLLTGIGTLAAGWYGKRRRKKNAAGDEPASPSEPETAI